MKIPEQPKSVTRAIIKLELSSNNDMPGIDPDWRLVERKHLAPLIEWARTLETLRTAK